MVFMMVFKCCLVLYLLHLSCGAVVDRCLYCSSTPVKDTIHEYDCSNCNLHDMPTFPPGALKINVSFNHISGIRSKAFFALSDLRELYLDNNVLSEVEICNGNNSVSLTLQRLGLRNNMLDNTSLGDLYCLQELQNLDIRGNVYNNYPESIPALLNLNLLQIDVFQDFHFNRSFLSLTNLSELVLQPRGMLTIENNSFEGLYNSPIRDMHMRFGGHVHKHIGKNFLYPFRFLKNLILDINRYFDIKEAMRVLYGLRGRTLDKIDVKENNWLSPRWHRITADDAAYLFTICVKEFNMAYDRIQHFPFVESLNTNFSFCLERLWMTQHSLLWTYSESLGLLSYPNLKFLFALVPFSYKGGVIARKSLSKQRNIQVNVSTKCWTKMEYIDISGVHLVLPFMDNNYSTLFINLPNLRFLYAGHTSLNLCNYRVKVNANLSILDMSGWDCSNHDPLFLRRHKNLTFLNASRSELGTQLNTGKSQSILLKLARLDSVDLSHNSINYLSDTFFIDQINSLRHIDLSFNNLKNVPVSLIHLRALEKIDLSYNNIAYLNKQDIGIIEKLQLQNTSFDFGGNKFECTCTNIDSLVWIKQAKNIKQNIICREGIYVPMNIKDLHAFQLRCLSGFWLDFAVTSILLLSLVILVAALGYRNKSLVVYFIIKARRFLKEANHEMQRSCKYDAFVSYSHLDDVWVTGQFFKYLTNTLHLEVCLHQKDFLPGAPIAEEILRCVESSRKSIFVITRNFLQSKWGLFEMDIARHHVLQSESDTLIIILKEDIPVHEMPLLLKKIWWRIVCLKYPQDNDPLELNMFNKKLSEIFKK